MTIYRSSYYNYVQTRLSVRSFLAQNSQKGTKKTPVVTNAVTNPVTTSAAQQMLPDGSMISKRVTLNKTSFRNNARFFWGVIVGAALILMKVFIRKVMLVRIGNLKEKRYTCHMLKN